MKLAINFSEPAAHLVSAGKIRIDLFKTPDWPDMVERARNILPVYVHFAINAGADDSRTTDWPAVDLLAKKTGTPFINLHLAPRQKDFPNRRAVIERLVTDVNKAIDFFGNRVIVENIPLGNPAENFADACAEPEVIHEIIQRTGAGFLLDLSHARLSANYFRRNQAEYISAMPIEHIRELHLTGLAMVDGRLRDHMPMGAEDWDMAAWALRMIHEGRWGKPWAVAFEYGGVGANFAWRTDGPTIAEQVPRLWELIHNFPPAGYNANQAKPV